MADLDKLILFSDIPGFHNLASGQFTINWSGTLPVPSGPVIGRLTASGSVTLDSAPRNVFWDISPSIGLNTTFYPNWYNANDVMPVGTPRIIPVSVQSNVYGIEEWEVHVYPSISGNTITLRLTAYNAGGTDIPITFNPLTFTVRYVAYLPTA